MNGYFDDPEGTAAALRPDGFLTAGDLATQDEEGFIRIVDRKKDMVIPGGQNIYPREIENELHRCPGVREVAIIGPPDDVWGERLAAFVVADPGARLEISAARSRRWACWAGAAHGDAAHVASGRTYRLAAERAQQLGLVTDVVPASQLLDRALEIVHVIAAHPLTCCAGQGVGVWVAVMDQRARPSDTALPCCAPGTKQTPAIATSPRSGRPGTLRGEDRRLRPRDLAGTDTLR